MGSWFRLLVALALLGGCGRNTEPVTPRTADPRLPGAPEPLNLRTSELLQPGQPVPASVIAGARHWQRTGAAGSRILVVNFGSTRCSAQSACAETEGKLRAVQDELRKTPSLKSSIGLLTVSVDPVNDMPAVLRAHADRIGADAELWRFAALPANQVDTILGQFGAARDEGVTAIVDADGKLVKIYATADWTAEDLARDVQSLVLRAEPAVLAAYIDAQQALAADDARGAKRALARLEAAVAEPAVDRLTNAAAAPADIAAMRAAFKPLSEAFVRLPWPREYQPMYCPMFDGNAGATWVQKAGPVVEPLLRKGDAALRDRHVSGRARRSLAKVRRRPVHGGRRVSSRRGDVHGRRDVPRARVRQLQAADASRALQGMARDWRPHDSTLTGRPTASRSMRVSERSRFLRN